MLRHGHRLIQRISPLRDSGSKSYRSLPEVLRNSLLPIVIVSLPLVLGSMVGSIWLMPLVVALTIVLLYFTALETDRFMFRISRVRAHLAVTMPLCTFVSVWGIALAMAGRKEMMLAIVGPYALLVLIACAPAYRLREARTRRRMPLHVSFPIVGSLVLLGSVAHFFE